MLWTATVRPVSRGEGKKGKKADEDEDTDGDAAAAKEPPADLLSVAADLCRAMDAAGSGGGARSSARRLAAG